MGECILRINFGSGYSASTSTLVSDTKMSVNQSDSLHIICDAGKQI